MKHGIKSKSKDDQAHLDALGDDHQEEGEHKEEEP
jgi:hypothetical protein